MNQTKETAAFIARVTIIHVLTYIFCGIIFSTLFNYNELFLLGNAKYFMRDTGSLSSVIGPSIQVIRGVIFGFVLLLFKDSVFGKPMAWLRLWAIVATLGIINTPGPAPFSIEGIIYTQLPLEFHLKGAPEILCQTLLFSIFITRRKREKIKLSGTTGTAFTVAIIAGVGFSVSGIILALAIGADFMAGATDAMAFVVMLVGLAVVFLATKYMKTQTLMTKVMYYLICYGALTVLPTVYNFVTNSPFKSWLSLLISALPVIAIAVYREIVLGKQK